MGDLKKSFETIARKRRFLYNKKGYGQFPAPLQKKKTYEELIMKLIHLSDLHIGKRVNGFSMIEDQIYILHRIVELIDQESPDGILMAGDIYDKTVPSAEAVQVFDGFLSDLAERKIPVFIISGNHDSAERLAFASGIMRNSRVYVSPAYNGIVRSVTLEDEWGEVNIFMLPFIKPVQIKNMFPEKQISSYTEAVAAAVQAMEIHLGQRNILLAHQLVTGAVRCESEELSIGGSDNVDAGVFDPFDYVALGHLHRPQQAGGAHIRYCGTPLKYSFSEAGHTKSVTILELKQKGELSISTAQLQPKRDMKKIKGSYMEVVERKFYEKLNREDYFHITLTDEEDIPDAASRLRSVYPNLMKLEYDNKRTRSGRDSVLEDPVETESPLELFAGFYRQQNNQEMSREQEEFLLKLVSEIWEEEI